MLELKIQLKKKKKNIWSFLDHIITASVYLPVYIKI